MACGNKPGEHDGQQIRNERASQSASHSNGRVEMVCEGDSPCLSRPTWSTNGTRPTSVPKRLADDLVASGIGFGEILSILLLLDLAVAVLGVSAVLVEGGHLHCFFYGREIDRGHRIIANEPAAGKRHAMIRDGRAR